MTDAGQTLRDSLRHLGVDSLTSQPNLWRSALRKQLADQPHQASLLVTALDAGVPSRLTNAATAEDIDAMTAQLARAYGIPPDNAQWAVQTWSQALGVAAPPTSTPTSPPTSTPPPAVGNVREDATVLRPATSAFTAPTRPPDGSTPSAAGPPSGPYTVLRDGPSYAPGSAPGYAQGGGTVPLPPPVTPTPRTRGRGRLIGVVGVLVLIAIIAGVAAFALRDSSDKPTSAAFASISPVLAHRGDHEGYPEETLPSFVQAARRGFTIETDIRWTRDGVPIINHDPTTGLGMVCRGGPFEVASTSWSVLRSHCRTPASASKTHRSYGIPTFADTVEQLSRISGATLFAELKIDQTPAQSKEYLAILRKWHMLPRTVATSYVDTYLEHFGTEVTREGVKIRTLRFAGANATVTVATLRRTHVWGVLFAQGWDQTPALTKSARRAGIHVGIITLSAHEGPTQWAEAKKLGAQFVLTDRPSSYQAWRGKH